MSIGAFPGLPRLLLLGFLFPSIAPAATPTPTPRPKTTRKLSGGSFGLPTNPTPTPGPAGSAFASRGAIKPQVDVTPSGGSKPRGVVITNETLRKTEPAPGGASITLTGTADSKPRVTAPPEPTPVPELSPEYRDASGQTEAQWRERASAARARVEKADADVAAGQAEVRRLENDFYAWSDGNYRERVIRPAWDQAKENLKLLEVEAGEARTALATLEEEARKSGTPPGWLR